jgi:hypothetical protein
MRLHIPRLDLNRPLKLPRCLVAIAVILVQQAEIVMHFGAGVVLFEHGPVLRKRVVKIADALIVERETEVIRQRR